MPLANSMARIRRELFKGLSRAIAIRSASTRIGHRTIKVPLVYGLGADHLGPQKPGWPLLLMQRVVEHWPGTVVDIGANVGAYLIQLKASSPECTYVGFEPNPACYYYLHELLVQNDFEPATVFPLALSDRQEVRRLYIREHGDKMGSFDPDHRWEVGRPRSLDLLTEMGDDIVSKSATEPVVFVKIDVEGAEMEVLNGLEATLTTQHPIVVCEIATEGRSETATAERGKRLKQIFSFMANLRYVFIALTSEGVIEECVSPEDIDNTQHIDRLLVPEKSRDEVLSMLRAELESQANPV